MDTLRIRFYGWRPLMRWVNLALLSLCWIQGGPSNVSAFPVITGFSPQSGAPGTSVSITGTDLGDSFDVLFNGVPALFTVVSANRIVTTVPLEATSGPISVFSTTGLATTLPHFIVSPRIWDFSPLSAPPGEVVLITGANLDGATAVQFNGTNAAFSVTSPTQVRAWVPSGVTPGPIRLTTPVGTATSAHDFEPLGKEPFISSFSPVNGAPGSVVTIVGVNFTGATGVQFGGSNAIASVTSPTQIRATVPPGASSGWISVTTPLGTGVSTAPFIVSTAPFIESFFPVAGGPGTDVVIDGLNFLGTTAVKFGGKNAQRFTVTAATQIHATVPAGATNAPISITTPRGTGTSFYEFIASAAPIVIGFWPTNGPPGTTIAVDGINLSGVQKVTLNGVNAGFRINAPTQLGVTVPANATSGFITLASAAGTNRSAEPFLVRTGKPIITSFDPEGGPARGMVTIEGLDFTGANMVRFNGVPATFVDVVSDSQISVRVPDAATSGPISVTTPAGTVSSSQRFAVAPQIVSFSPAIGTAGTPVTIRGTNFGDLNTVRFKEVAAAIVARSTNEITAAVPDEATTGSINLIGAAGIVATTNVFVVTPGVRRFTPTSGLAGTQVTVDGTGFGEVTGVRFGNLNAASFQVVSPTQVVAVVPARAASGPISVITTSGTGSSAQSFFVGPTADLALAQTQSTNSVLQNQLLTFTLTLTNRGPSTATGVVLSNDLSPDVALSSVTVSQGTYSKEGTVIRVNLGNLNNGATSRVAVTVLTLGLGSVTNIASVIAREQDPDLTNNVVTAAALVLANPAVLQVEEALTGLRVSWPVTATNFVLQSTDALGASVPWQAVAATPVVSGNRKSVVLPVTDRNRFYRLHRP